MEESSPQPVVHVLQASVEPTVLKVSLVNLILVFNALKYDATLTLTSSASV